MTEPVLCKDLLCTHNVWIIVVQEFELRSDAKQQTEQQQRIYARIAMPLVASQYRFLAIK
jgi:hypothetical protein